MTIEVRLVPEQRRSKVVGPEAKKRRNCGGEGESGNLKRRRRRRSPAARNRNFSVSLQRRRRSPAARNRNFSVSLQRLYLSCLDVFKGVGTVPSPPDVHKLCHILDNMTPEDVGLNPEVQFFKPVRVGGVGGTPKVTRTTIYECRNFSLCIFFLPANAVIPLHNHPGMTVFSKLLLGKCHVKAYDLVPSEDDVGEDDDSPAVKLARLKADAVFSSPCSTSVLFPTSGGNIHAFTAITPCLILDVLGPPYSKDDDRDCSYYTDIPYASLAYERNAMSEEESRSYWWLREIEMPEESEMYAIEYLGPQIIVDDSSISP